MYALLLFALLATAQGRAVNISNTWVLPEEGFPVFYRYFRDRISWYEADAVCQFHHANLVTVDTTAQYDAVRAYLKELDISSAVWVGLIRSNPDGDFTWTDYRGLSGDGYWSSAPDARSAPLCAAADPAADYRWEARACGGPTVASFICELPVPQWALGNEGCMVRALPALTVLYLPESAAVQLTADCGLAGVKRVQCIGNVKHEELLRDLSCTDEDDTIANTSMSSTVTTWVTTEGDQEINDVTLEENILTEQENYTNPSNSITSNPTVFNHDLIIPTKLVPVQQPKQTQDNKILKTKNINFVVDQYNNLQSNDIPKLATHDNFYSNEYLNKEEDEKLTQHKLLHDELARLGNFENIFSQPTDHFVPPLVMAKAKVNNDMTAVSFEEKLAQQHTEYRQAKHIDESNNTLNTEASDIDLKSTINDSSIYTSEKPQTNTINIMKDKNEIIKYSLPKKYVHKLNDVKSKAHPIKFMKTLKSTTTPSQTDIEEQKQEVTTMKGIVYFDPENEDSSLDLTVILKESKFNSNATNISFNVSDILNTVNTTYNSETFDKTQQNLSTVQTTTSNDSAMSTESSVKHNATLNDEIIKITFISDNNDSPLNSTVFEITTKMPIFKDLNESIFHMTSVQVTLPTEKTYDTTTSANHFARTITKDEVTTSFATEINDTNVMNITDSYETSKPIDHLTNPNADSNSEISIINVTTNQLYNENNEDVETSPTNTTQLTVKATGIDITELEHFDDSERNSTDTSQYIDDYQSPLLSGANEPIHKPARSRRPQQPANRIKKFNPFRILG